MRDHPSKDPLNPRLTRSCTARRKLRAHQLGIASWWALPVTALFLSLAERSLIAGPGGTSVLLPDGTEFISWEQPLQFTKTYYVDNQNPRAADSNPDTKELPFSTINKPAQVLQPGERVMIMSGVYRERVVPKRGGASPHSEDLPASFG